MVRIGKLSITVYAIIGQADSIDTFRIKIALSGSNFKIKNSKTPSENVESCLDRIVFFWSFKKNCYI